MAVQVVTRARAGLLACMLAGALAGPGVAFAQAGSGKPPSTFGPVIGAALLCHDQIDNVYFYNYLQTAFGPPYKHAGGAFWFRTDEAQLWGAPVSEVMVSDDT